MSDVQKSAGLVALTVFALALIAGAGWGLMHETAPKLSDPHAIALGVGLLLLPSVPTRLANAVRTVGSALVDTWKAKNTPAGPNAS